jgi:hypothetical protein
MTIGETGRSLSALSGTYSGRTMMTSFGLHGLALAVLLLVPMGALRHSARPKELDVTFHRPTPRIEPPPPPVPAKAVAVAAAGLRPSRIEKPLPLAGPPAPAAAAPVDPLPQEPPAYAVVETPPEKKVEESGILAFKDKFARLAQDDVSPRLGAQAHVGVADDGKRGGSRSGSVLTAGGPGGSGGIDVASLNRSVGGGAGRAGGGPGGDGTGVSIGRATSSIAGIGGGERPLSKGGPGPSRTDEEIQIVFDRYKASFYRLYNRELRTDPTLQGQMVLRLTIEPDGSVSMCVLQSTEMNAPELSVQVVNRVKTMNFGAKEGVQALTIVYPIDFLPAA